VLAQFRDYGEFSFAAPEASWSLNPGLANGLRVRFAVDSLLEQRRFELPVLFVVPGAYEKARSLSEGHCAKADQRIILRAICWQIRAENGTTSDYLQGGKRPKRTGGSNPLRSSNEALRTAGLISQ